MEKQVKNNNSNELEVKISSKSKKKEDNIFKKKTRINWYFSFENRVFLLVSLIVISLSLGFIYLSSSLVYNDKKVLNYNEKSNIDYKVYLKDNDFYDTNYLGKDMVYVASLIDHISTKFNYSFKIDEKENINFTYDIIGKLSIRDVESGNVYFEKDYTILKEKKELIRDKDSFNLTENINIDYNKYNTLANKFRQKYGVDAKSDLVVYLRINKNSVMNSNIKLNNTSNMSLTIPLSKSAVNINLSYKEVNSSNKVVSKKSYKIANFSSFMFSVLLFILAFIFVIILLIMLSKLTKSKSNYDRYIAKLLKEYDRLIVETTSKPDTKGKTIIDIKDFKELLDVRDNLNLPIKYFIVNEHQKCNFYINHEDELYLLVIKSVDLDK